MGLFGKKKKEDGLDMPLPEFPKFEEFKLPAYEHEIGKREEQEKPFGELRPSFAERPIEKFEKPLRLCSNKADVTSTILILGLACTKVDIGLNPMIHGISPIQNEYRHALVSFLLMPN